MKQIPGLLIIFILCSACVSPVKLNVADADDMQWLLSGEALSHISKQDITLPEERVLYLNREMREFAEKAVRGYAGKDRMNALVRAILLPSGLALKYDVQATFTAEEVFLERRANCLSFTNLFVAMGRYLDLDVQYNEVDVPPIWDLRRGNTLVLNKHINAMVAWNRFERHVIDLNIEEYDSYYEQRNITDQLAVAQHYNNKAMGYLFSSEYYDAFRFMVKAINMAPEKSYLWNNLGSLYRRAGNIEAAEKAYLISLAENPDDLVAMSNVARLYNEIGDVDLAIYYEKQAHDYRMRNPYFLYNLAQRAFVDRDYELAREHTQGAILQYDKEHRFYFLLGAIYQKTGESELADDNFSRALELSGDNEQQSRYRNKMERISSLSS
ncbi:MAG: tetratricopeptide repeat protein [Gammaproteobacteria bacterium]|jgi:Flp pilus assembly protein TadD|nr:tetratricopeptide repeat protein [Flavobacteriales bacterium]MBT7952786.1 tetratricopeptide repeat protein [Gammaproteobacteria bacterium]